MTVSMDEVRVRAGRQLNIIGDMFSAEVAGRVFCIREPGAKPWEGQEYVLTEQGDVWRKKDDFEYLPEADATAIARVRAMSEEDVETELARRRYAEMVADGDELLCQILVMALWYFQGVLSEPTEREGICFYQIGRNASHEFYAGVKDGVRYRMSVGEDYCEKQDDFVLRHNISVVEGEWGYMGHC